MTGSQSIESARAIASLEARINDLQNQVDRRCADLKEDIAEVKDDLSEDIGAVRNAQWWFFGLVVTGMVTLLIAFASGALGQ